MLQADRARFVVSNRYFASNFCYSTSSTEVVATGQKEYKKKIEWGEKRTMWKIEKSLLQLWKLRFDSSWFFVVVRSRECVFCFFSFYFCFISLHEFWAVPVLLLYSFICSSFVRFLSIVRIDFFPILANNTKYGCINMNWLLLWQRLLFLMNVSEIKTSSATVALASISYLPFRIA